MDAEASRVSPLQAPHLESKADISYSSLNERAARKYPDQFRTAQGRFPAPVDY